MKKFLSATSKKILKEIESLIPDKPGCITIYARTNDITNNINSLNSVRKIVNHVKFLNTKLVFSSILLKNVKDT